MQLIKHNVFWAASTTRTVQKHHKQKGKSTFQAAANYKTSTDCFWSYIQKKRRIVVMALQKYTFVGMHGATLPVASGTLKKKLKPGDPRHNKWHLL